MALFTTPGSSLGGITGSASLARLLVVVSGNTAGLTGALGQGAASLQAFNQNANALGNSLIRGVTLPTLALGGAAIKMASDYQTAMGRVAGLTTLTADQVNEANQSILDLAQEVPTAPEALADSLYFAGSAGLSFSQAMSVVELSAKGAAIGMGDASDISRVLIASLNAFQGDALTAEQAMDSLTAAIRVGTAEPNELAVALGRLLPIAAEVGVTFGETVAQVAALTNIGVPTKVATTSLRALFAQFLAPTGQATENLEALGISLEELQTALDAGPLVAFNLLSEALDGDTVALRKIIPQIRGLTGFLGLADEKAEDSARALNAVRNSTGALDRAFNIIAQTSGFKFQLALNDLRVAAIEFGTVLLPVFNSLISVLSDVGESIAGIPGPMKAVLAAVLGLAAAMGPLLKLWGALNASGAGFLSTLPAMGAGFLTFAAAAAIATGSLQSMADGTAGLGTSLIGVVTALTAARTGIGLISQLANRGAFGVNALSLALAGMGNAAAIAASVGITALIVGITFLVSKSREMAREAERLGAAFNGAASSGASMVSFLNQLEREDVRVADTLREIAEAANLLNQSTAEGAPELLSGLTTQIAALNRELLASDLRGGDIGGQFIESLQNAQPVLNAVSGTTKELSRAFEQSGGSLGDFASALDEVASQHPDENVRATAEALKAQALAAQEAANAYHEFQDETEARLALSLQEETAVDSLAQKYGVSVDVIRRELGEAGIAAIGLTDETERQFGIQAGLLDGLTGAHVGAQNEIRAAEAEAIAARQEGLRDSLSLFADVEDAANKSASALVASAEKTADSAQQMAQDVQTLLARGLDPGVLQQLVDQGPAMVGKFADASIPELRRLETAYALSMGAIDATILNEGKHQQVKGNDMVAGFAQAILSNKDLPAGAADQIMAGVERALVSGKLKPAGLQAIQDFAEGLVANKNVPVQKIGPIVNAFTTALTRNPALARGGRQAIQEFAQGLQESSNLPKQVITSIVTQLGHTFAQGQSVIHEGGRRTAAAFANGLLGGRPAALAAGQALESAAASGAQGSLFAQGASLGSSLAAGIRSTIGTVISAVVAAVNAAKAAAEKAGHDSPHYFTYYMGQRMMRDYQAGVDNSKQVVLGRPVGLPAAGQPGQMHSLKGLAIEGTLDTPFGPAKVRGFIRDELRDGRIIDRGMARAVARQRVR